MRVRSSEPIAGTEQRPIKDGTLKVGRSIKSVEGILCKTRQRRTSTPSCKMGKKKGNTGKKVLNRPSMDNPMMLNNGSLTSEQADKVLEEIMRALESCFRKPVSNKEAVLEIIKEDPDFKKETDFKVRFKRIKAKKKEMIEENEDPGKSRSLAGQFCLGLRQCLKELSKGQGEISAVFYDKEVNFEPLRSIFDKGQFPFFSLQGLNSSCKTAFGISCTVFALKRSFQKSEFPESLKSMEIFSPKTLPLPVVEPKMATVKTDPEVTVKKADDFGSDFIKF